MCLHDGGMERYLFDGEAVVADMLASIPQSAMGFTSPSQSEVETTPAPTQV